MSDSDRAKIADAAILFCDIDGVLVDYYGSRMTPHAVAALKMFRAAGFEFVVHSTWRHGMVAEATKLFTDAGFAQPDFCPADPPSKRAAIVDYLRVRYGDDWPRCVVIDDHPIDPCEGLDIVRIGKDGLTVEIARKILAGIGGDDASE